MIKTTVAAFIVVLLAINVVCGQQSSSTIPHNFVVDFYQAYSGVPKAERLLSFYDDEVVIDDPTYDWVGKTKAEIFRNFDRNNLNNHYTWRVDQQIVKGDTLVTEGLLKARYADLPYEMRFVNIFHFKNGKIIKQYDYFDNKDWYKVVEEHKRKEGNKR